VVSSSGKAAKAQHVHIHGWHSTEEHRGVGGFWSSSGSLQQSSISPVMRYQAWPGMDTTVGMLARMV
jgi:hypothetical protein